MSNIVLWIALVILVFMTVLGYIKGFVRMAFSMLSFVIVLFLVNTLTPAVTSALEETAFYESVEDGILEKVSESISSAVGDTSSMGVSAQTSFIESLPVPSSIQQLLIDNNTSEGYETIAADNFVSYLSGSITQVLLNAAIYVILFAVLMILMRVLIRLLNIVTKLPVIRFLNKTLGSIFGFAQGVLILWVCCIVLTAFGRTEWAQAAFTEINSSSFLSFIYEMNMLSGVVTGIFG